MEAIPGPLSRAEALREAARMASVLEEAHRTGAAENDERMDVYEFGCALFQMLTGRPVTSARRRVEPPRLEKFLVKCLASEPAERFQTIAEMNAALDKLA